jgi:hypothetical protein
MENNINEKYFAPIFEDYLKGIEPFKDCGYWQLPFIPYTFPLYESSPLKVFYVGRDTYYWCEYAEEYYADPKAYLKDNSEFVTSNKIKEEEEWKEGRFWGMVGKLHLQLLTGIYHESVNDLTEKDFKLLEGIGYGNLYSIETPQTLKKKYSGGERSEWDDIKDVSGYKKLRLMARPFEQLKTIFEAYGEPDVVFVLSWSNKEDVFFEGLDYEQKEEWFENDFRAVYLSKTHRTKVIWTSHPNRYRFLRTDTEKMCQYLCDTYKTLEHVTEERTKSPTCMK